MKEEIERVCDEIKALLVEKNRKYGNSALDPIRVFSNANTVEQIKVRIDDKLSRIKSAQSDEDEDVINDLIGYLILLKIAESKASESQRREKWTPELMRCPCDFSPIIPETEDDEETEEAMPTPYEAGLPVTHSDDYERPAASFLVFGNASLERAKQLDEILHSGGRCTCYGEGRCEFCKRCDSELEDIENRLAENESLRDQVKQLSDENEKLKKQVGAPNSLAGRRFA